MSAKLPNAELAVIEQQKVQNYLLNLNHADGESKAKFFLARGFDGAAWQTMCDALRSQGQNNRVTKIVPTLWGTRYQVDCHCPTPDGANPCIRTIWEVSEQSDAPRLLTAYPLDN